MKALAIIPLLLLLLASPAYALPSAQATVEDATLNILSVLSVKTKPMPARLDAAWRYAEPVLDLEEFTRRALNQHWQEMTPGQRQEAIRLMSGFMRQAVFAQLARYNGQQVAFRDEVCEGPYCAVLATVTGLDGDTTKVEFITRRDASGRWGVFDIRVEGFSFLINYRAQFQQLWKKGGYEAVRAALEGKQ